MNVSSAAARISLEARARQSLGASNDAIHEMVADAVDRHDIKGARIVDVGCGHGSLRGALHHRSRNTGVSTPCATSDFPRKASSRASIWTTSTGRRSPPARIFVTAVETIEHLENPWAFVRHLAALAAPGGWVILTTPNQLSLLSRSRSPR